MQALHYEDALFPKRDLVDLSAAAAPLKVKGRKGGMAGFQKFPESFVDQRQVQRINRFHVGAPVGKPGIELHPEEEIVERNDRRRDSAASKLLGNLVRCRGFPRRRRPRKQHDAVTSLRLQDQINHLVDLVLITLFAL